MERRDSVWQKKSRAFDRKAENHGKDEALFQEMAAAWL